MGPTLVAVPLRSVLRQSLAVDCAVWLHLSGFRPPPRRLYHTLFDADGCAAPPTPPRVSVPFLRRQPSSLFVSPQFISLFQFTHVTDLLPQNLLFALRHGVSTRAEAAAVEAQALNVGPGWFRSTRVADRSWPGYKEWRVQSLIRQLPHAQRSTLYVCQPDAMILTSLAAELKQQQRQQGSQQSGQWQGAPPASANHNGKRKRTDGSAGGDGETSGGQRGSADHPSAQHPPPRSPQLQDMPAPSSLETVCMTEQVFQQFASFGGRNYLTSLTFVYTPAAPHDCQEAIDQMSSEMSGPTRPPPPSTTSV